MLSAVCGPIVSFGRNNHSNCAADDGDDGSHQEGNGSDDPLLGEESDDDEHDGGEYKADQILLFEEFEGALNLKKCTSEIL